MYQKEDIWQCYFDGTSGSKWDISPPSIERLNEELISDHNVSIYFTVDFTRSVIQCLAVIFFLLTYMIHLCLAIINFCSLINCFAVAGVCWSSEM